jgi:hypothetical protein
LFIQFSLSTRLLDTVGANIWQMNTRCALDVFKGWKKSGAYTARVANKSTLHLRLTSGISTARKWAGSDHSELRLHCNDGLSACSHLHLAPRHPYPHLRLASPLSCTPHHTRINSLTPALRTPTRTSTGIDRLTSTDASARAQNVLPHRTHQTRPPSNAKPPPSRLRIEYTCAKPPRLSQASRGVRAQ